MELHKGHSIAALFTFLFSILSLSSPSYAIIRSVEGTDLGTDQSHVSYWYTIKFTLIAKVLR